MATEGDGKRDVVGDWESEKRMRSWELVRDVLCSWQYFERDDFYA